MEYTVYYLRIKFSIILMHVVALGLPMVKVSSAHKDWTLYKVI